MEAAAGSHTRGSSASVVMPSFIRAPSFPAAGAVMPYPVVCPASSADSRQQPMPRPGHVIPSRPPVAAGHVMPVGYAMPYAPSVPRGRLDSGGGNGKASPKNSSMKLRIHHVKDDDFKPQAKSGEKKRRRPWRGREKEGDGADLRKSSPRLRRLASDGDGKPSVASAAEAPAPGSSLPGTSQAGATDAENYGLNILAACSSIQSKEHQKEAVVPAASRDEAPPKSISLQRGSGSRHPQLPSPVSLAGANTLLLLGKDAHGHQPPASTTAPSSTIPIRVTAAESTVVDSLLELRASKPTMKPPSLTAVGQAQNAVGSESSEIGERSTRSASYSAAEAMLMFAQDVTKSDGANEDATRGGSAAGWREESDVFENGKRSGVQQLRSPKSLPAKDSSPSTGLPDKLDRPEKLDLDSEATDTDSEATLSPNSPRMKDLELGPTDGMEPGLKEEVPHSEPSLTEVPPFRPNLELEPAPNQSPVQGAETEYARISPSPPQPQNLSQPPQPP